MADDARAANGQVIPRTPSPRDFTQGASESPHESTAAVITEAEPDIDEAPTHDAVSGDDAEDYDAESAGEGAKPARKAMPFERLALVVGLVVVVALAGLGGWLGYRAYESHQAKEQRELFLQVGRQGAINLTTIDFSEADTDVGRILNSATGTFYDDFSKRSQPFVDVVKQAQSKSVGTVTAAGIESETDNAAQVLVAVTVKTSNAGAAEQQPRAWRMRISVQRIGHEAKVSNVEFVP